MLSLLKSINMFLRSFIYDKKSIVNNSDNSDNSSVNNSDDSSVNNSDDSSVNNSDDSSEKSSSCTCMCTCKENIIEFYSDYWLGCTASKFIVNEFKKNKPDIPIVSVNASKKNYKDIIEKYDLEFTPTYVLVDSNADKLFKRVGNFKLEKFTSLTS